VQPGRFLHVILKIPVGAATASQVIRGTVRIDGHAFPSRGEADAERAACDEDCDSCDGGTHTLIYRDKQAWRVP
jgi:hypothetical protein